MEFWNLPVSFGVIDAHAAEVLTQGFEEVVELVAHVSDAESGALADLVVFKVFVVFEFQEGPVLVPEFGQEEADGSRGPHAGQMPLGAAGGVPPQGHLVG